MSKLLLCFDNFSLETIFSFFLPCSICSNIAYAGRIVSSQLEVAWTSRAIQFFISESSSNFHPLSGNLIANLLSVCKCLRRSPLSLNSLKNWSKKLLHSYNLPTIQVSYLHLRVFFFSKNYAYY